MRKFTWCANLFLAAISALAIVHVGTYVSGAGIGVRITKLRSEGVIDLEKAYQAYPEWRDGDSLDQEKLGRYIAASHFGAECVFAVTGLSVAAINLLSLRSRTA